MSQFKPLIAKVAAGLPLSSAEAEMAFSQILSGESTPAQTAGSVPGSVHGTVVCNAI